ncbi:MAG: PrsW family intramembrane metalloprotease [Lachnospiraceae bacterium]|nr:PrsW family intramembrane metalloprotease [Lachnospiraceae bacterium]
MFYFLPLMMSYNVILILAAIIPAVILLIVVYKSDRLEKESPKMLLKLLLFGVIAALIALVSEKIFSLPLVLFENSPTLYNIILYFIVVAGSEECAKYLMLYLGSWRSKDFDCQYDGVVYSVFVSLGFAIWENISYVLHYGFTTALVRAVTAIPGHACFGIFMGIFYGIARKNAALGNKGGKRTCQILAIILPALLHGTYDFIASSNASDWFFIIFIAAMFIASFILVRKNSRKDNYI